MRRLLDGVGRRAVYVVMTAVLAVPVWYATRSHFDIAGANTVSLDVVPEPAGNPPSPAAGAKQTSAAQAAPYMASIAAVPRNAVEPTPSVAVDNALTLHFNGESWMQVSAPDGKVIESNLVQSGVSRSYPPGQVGRVVLGNAAVVEVQHSGHIVDLKPFQRANVARFAVSSDGAVVPASE
jgi:cytoskeleton protein RodZ